VPQGFGHYIENTGETDLEIVLILNNATYQSISITSWMSSTPDLLLATNFQGAGGNLRRLPERRGGDAGAGLIA
jgi:oxalate decarboxylase/phosphoglucose isomerase-like protein (cupin superfamily)